jgi:dipeptidyl aminopeptidase/acylaminoacyl peptidase
LRFRACTTTVASILLGTGGLSASAWAAHPFTTADDIKLSLFGDPYEDKVDALTFSPNGQYVVVATQRGLLVKNTPESTLWVYRLQEIRQYLQAPRRSRVHPYWVIRESTYPHGPIITRVQWLPNSTGFGYLVRSALGYNQLFLANIKSRRSRVATPKTENVVDFDLRDWAHYVYSITAPSIFRESPTGNETGKSLGRLIFPPARDPWEALHSFLYDRQEVWAVYGKKPSRVFDSSGNPIQLRYSVGGRNLALSPSGPLVVAVIPVRNVPPQWRNLFPPPLTGGSWTSGQGVQNLDADSGIDFAAEYVLINLEANQVRSLTNAPTGRTSGWWGAEGASWSPDGTDVVVQDTFLAQSSRVMARPCVAVISITTGVSSCLEQVQMPQLDGGGARAIKAARFQGDNSVVRVEHGSSVVPHDASLYGRAKDGSWTVLEEAQPAAVERPVALKVEESLNAPPVLTATLMQTGVSRVILNPNPELDDARIGEASPVTWRDASGRAWTGGLYKPSASEWAPPYPLVIQTHGFSEKQFSASGAYPTVFAARELAAVGIAVLQAPDCREEIGASGERACSVEEYEGAVRKLTALGLANGRSLGIIGFSRTCFNVLATLIERKSEYAAAVIADGITMGYFEFMAFWDSTNGNSIAREAEIANGGAPVGQGLRPWIEHSPGFNIASVFTPLRVVASGPTSILGMWEPYAALRVLGRPVELIVLGDGTHVLSNPHQRLLSQGGTVDWMRFWLQGYEDPSTDKADQYRRWEKLCDMQVEQNPNRPAFCVRSKTH